MKKAPYQGYAEGYYGRLLSWQERLQILDTLHRLNFNTYYYAPKEDPWHRYDWRTAYDAQWQTGFAHFCQQAAQRDIQVVAGVAPGLNFDFADLPEGRDFQSLVDKCNMLLGKGADAISLLMDDIDADFEQRRGQFSSEGAAHATLANRLAQSLGARTNRDSQQLSGSELRLWVTPRIYADELIAQAPTYLQDFVTTLDTHHIVLYCGSDVVAREINAHSAQALTAAMTADTCHEVVFWDNLYANDYCPRRLFVGPWRHRNAIENVVLNPTGMVHTDCLLLELMAIQRQAESEHKSASGVDEQTAMDLWRYTLLRHDVPDAFFHIMHYFFYPVFNQDCQSEQHKLLDSDDIRAAIEQCLWCWKTPLSREWYPFIFGLKHDLLSDSGEHLALRIRKTQPRPLSDFLQK